MKNQEDFDLYREERAELEANGLADRVITFDAWVDRQTLQASIFDELISLRDAEHQEEGDCDQIAEEAIEARNDEWASHQTAIDEQYGQ
jgi:hypothetical protein